MNVVQMGGDVLRLRNGIPAFVSEFPLILIGDSETTAAQGFQTDWSIWAQDDGDRMDIVPWPRRVHGVGGELSLPSRELEDAVVGHSFSHIFQLRRQRDDVTGL